MWLRSNGRNPLGEWLSYPDHLELVLLVEDASTTSVKLSGADLREGVARFLLVLEDTS